MSYIDVAKLMRGLGFGFHHTNSYSMSSMIGLLLGVQAKRYGLLKHNIFNYLIILNLIAFLGGTSSASYISCAVGFILLFASTETGLRLDRLIVILLLGVCCYHLAVDEIYEFIFVGKTQENIETSSGREQIFNAAINSWKANPILGSGYIVGERALGKYGLEINVLSTHNSFLGSFSNFLPLKYISASISSVIKSIFVGTVKTSKQNSRYSASSLVSSLLNLLKNHGCIIFPFLGHIP